MHCKKIQILCSEYENGLLVYILKAWQDKMI